MVLGERLLVLSVDPGQQTGIVGLGVASSGFQILLYDVVPVERLDLVAMVAGMQPLGFEWPRLELVCERPPIKVHDPSSLTGYSSLREQARRVKKPLLSYGPGEWKPSAKRYQLHYPPEIRSPHTRDAYAMAMYHLRTRHYADFGFMREPLWSLPTSAR